MKVFSGRSEPVFLVWRQTQGVRELDNRTLRRRCAVLVDSLTIPVPFGLDAFCEQLGRDRGRPISRLAVDLPAGGPCGLLVSTDEAEVVLVERRTTEWHQRHIVLHELGHLLWGHDRLMAPATSTLLLPHLDPEMVHRVLARTSYSELEERQAETVASLILERVSRLAPETRWSARASVDAEALHRVEESLHGRSLGGARG